MGATKTKTTTVTYHFTVGQLHEGVDLSWDKAIALAPTFAERECDAHTLTVEAEGPRQALAAVYRHLAEVLNHLAGDLPLTDVVEIPAIEMDARSSAPLAIVAKGVGARRIVEGW